MTSSTPVTVTVCGVSQSRSVNVSCAVASGIASETIVDYAKNNAVGHIVIGSHSRKGLARALLGSVAERVARTADCPVTIVPATPDS